MNTSAFSDEDLMAYADGELDAVRAGEIRQACLDDARIAARVEMFRASRQLLTDAFESVLHEQIPDRLLETIDGLDESKGRKIAAHPHAAKVYPAPVRRRSRFVPALAASITAFGVLTAGWFFHSAPSLSGSQAASLAGVAPLADTVQVALERTASGEIMHGRIGGNAVDVVPLSTFSNGNTYCREFGVTPTGNESASTQRGVACRDGTRWIALVMSGQTRKSPADDSYQTASGDSDPARVMGHSVPLTSDQERDLIAHGWKSP